MALDERSLGLLFERHAKLIYNYCFRRVGNWATAEDLVSVVFLEAWRKRGTLLDPEKALPWLYGIATNVVRNRRRWNYVNESSAERIDDGTVGVFSVSERRPRDLHP